MSSPAENVVKVISKLNFTNQKILKEFLPLYSRYMYMVASIMMEKWSGKISGIPCNIDVLAWRGVWCTTRHSIVRHDIVAFESSWRRHIISAKLFNLSLSKIKIKTSTTKRTMVDFVQTLQFFDRELDLPITNGTFMHEGRCLMIPLIPRIISSQGGFSATSLMTLCEKLA